MVHLRRAGAVVVLVATVAWAQSSLLGACTPQSATPTAQSAITNPGRSEIVTGDDVRCPADAVAGKNGEVTSHGTPAAMSLSDRDRLTGNWNGARTALSARGIDLQLELTGFVQGMLAGTGDDDTEPGGRVDALVNFDTAKLGLWRGSGVRTHVEAALGNIPTFRAGAVLPMHAATMLPLGDATKWP